MTEIKETKENGEGNKLLLYSSKCKSGSTELYIEAKDHNICGNSSVKKRKNKQSVH